MHDTIRCCLLLRRMAAKSADVVKVADEKRAASPVRSKRSRSRSRSPRRHETAAAATAAPAPTSATKTDHIRELAQVVCLVHFRHEPNLTEAELKVDYETVASACLGAIHAHDWVPLQTLKVRSCPAELQKLIDDTVDSLITASEEKRDASVHVHTIMSYLLSASHFEPMQRSEVAVWITLFVRLCARCVAKGYTFNKEANDYMLSTPTMKLARACYATSRRKETQPLRARVYETVSNTFQWMLYRNPRRKEQLVDDAGGEIPYREHGFCGYRQCLRNIIEYASPEYGYCNNRHMEKCHWITPASEKKHDPEYRCWEHGTRKFLAIEAAKFEATKARRDAAVAAVAAAKARLAAAAAADAAAASANTMTAVCVATTAT